MPEIEKMLKSKPRHVAAIYSKAEALYGSGLFEKAMIQYVRGSRLRSDYKYRAFHKGISFCKNAITEALNDIKIDEKSVKNWKNTTKETFKISLGKKELKSKYPLGRFHALFLKPMLVSRFALPELTHRKRCNERSINF